MSNILTVVPSDVNLPKAASERQIAPATWAALKGALYPGKSDEMVILAFDYCRARGLDPVKKPVHIVNTWDAEQGRMIETLWEGISSHRTTAARTGVYAGQDEPDFGPEVTSHLGSSQVTYPSWCKITVYRIVSGYRSPFTGVIRWRETYSRKKDGTPTAQWIKRPYGQAAKCAEAEALRKAFPEELGGRPTAEEMDGQGFDSARDITPPAVSRLDALEKTLSGVAQDAPERVPAVDPDLGDDVKDMKGDPSDHSTTGSGKRAPSAWDSKAVESGYQVGDPTTRTVRNFATVKDWCNAICALAHQKSAAERARLWKSNVKVFEAMRDDGTDDEIKYLAYAEQFVNGPDMVGPV